MPETDYKAMLFERSARMLKVNGIISIVLGGLAILFVLFYIVLITATSLISTDPSVPTTSLDAAGNVLLSLIVFVLLLAPCIYTLIAGIVLVRLPRPAVAKGLLIANIVIGAFANTIGLIFAIISLTQIHDYAVGYKHAK